MPRISSETLDIHHDGGGLVESEHHADSRVYDLVTHLVEDKVAERDEMLLELLESPHEALIAEFDYMKQLYKDRIVETKGRDGRNELQFATRNWDDEHDQYEIDDRYMMKELNDGTIVYTIQTMLVPNAGYDIVFTDSDILSARVLNGSYATPLPESHYSRVSGDVMKRTIATARIVDERRRKYPETAAYADQHARELLEAELDL